MTSQATVQMVGSGGQGVVNVITNDDTVWTWGTDKDIAMVLRSTSLVANTALASVLVGTPVTRAVDANSAILSNITASGDILVAANRGGNSESYLLIDSSAGDLYLDSRGTGNIVLTPGGDIVDVVGGAGIELDEAAADLAAPAADNARIYARDNGAGKTQVVVRFPTGAVQVLATEP